MVTWLGQTPAATGQQDFAPSSTGGRRKLCRQALAEKCVDAARILVVLPPLEDRAVVHMEEQQGAFVQPSAFPLRHGRVHTDRVRLAADDIVQLRPERTARKLSEPAKVGKTGVPA